MIDLMPYPFFLFKQIRSLNKNQSMLKLTCRHLRALHLNFEDLQKVDIYLSKHVARELIQERPETFSNHGSFLILKYRQRYDRLCIRHLYL